MPIRRHLAEQNTVTQRNQLRLDKSFFTQPTVIFVRRGRKILRWMGGEQIVCAGEMVLLAENQRFDVINEPDGQGIYEADWLSIDSAVIARFARQNTQKPFEILFYLPEHSLTCQAFERASQALSQPEIPDAVVEIRLWELLAWLATRGGAFGTVSSLLLSKRIRQKIAEDTGYAWTAAEVARDLNMSEATLRRHLAEEKTSFREILTLVRMMRALSLLQLTQRPILQIAYEVGYDSHSRFSAKFKQHFGCAPNKVRRSNSAIDLNALAPP